LALEKARFDERLNLQYNLQVTDLIMVPPLSIQPIVENAVHHGIMQRAAGGTIRLTLEVKNKQIRVEVSDDGVGMPREQLVKLLTDKHSGGVGLQNIHRRLRMLYGQGLHVVSTKGIGTTVSFEIPVTASTPSTTRSEHDESHSD
jgi:sensor histidine kinase YesM